MKVTAIHSKNTGSTRAFAGLLLDEIKKRRASLFKKPGLPNEDFIRALFSA